MRVSINGVSSVPTFFVGFCLPLFLLWAVFRPADVQATSRYRQPAYISNAYFSDEIAKDGEQIQPLTVIKSLHTRDSGEVGYFILDLVLTHPGRHEFKVNILNKSGNKVMELTFPKVKAPKKSRLPLYTAVGSISGKVYPGLWFFKVYDRVNSSMWHRIGVFAITIADPDDEN